MYPAAAKKYDRIIVVSEAEKKNYIKYIGTQQSKFRVINLAADKRFQVIEDCSRLQAVKNKYNLPDRFLLFVGRILPVKNIETIINAYKIAKKRKRFDHKMVIVGHKTWFFPKIFSLIENLKLSDDIIFTGPVYDELPAIYNLAHLFLFPSFYEAFPAVPLEAMACGTPVISSNTGGLPEVVGDAALQVSPNNPNTFADAIIKILSSNKLRKSLIEKGFERTKNFSWESSANKTLDVYSEMARI